RKNQNRPAPHPTSMHPKLARAMVNLAGRTKNILDPFCGSGGILIEAALMHKQATGIDIDPAMITRAKKNLEHYHGTARLIVGDATSTEAQADAIITDLPYGRNSKAARLNELYAAFLDQAKNITRKLVIAFPERVDGEALLNRRGWDASQRFTWQLHKTLTKEIFTATTD
ncbi:methyltransferase domain-containing protein, partial [Candidatus Woesearchaeota archaeon]|nr:methyltransferase domain-containing protein [Candidatus Woesearchaeota archaeon]